MSVAAGLFVGHLLLTLGIAVGHWLLSRAINSLL
jgi:hypothetical protein